jgi:single stranded DNA-binding protein
MAKSVNKVILVGNVGQDPEVKYTASGVPVAKVSIATNERFKGKNDQWQDRTEWHSVVAWQRLAEIVGEYVHKGSKLYVEGKLQTSTWEDKQNGQKKYRTEKSPGRLSCSVRETTATKKGKKCPLRNLAPRQCPRTLRTSPSKWTESRRIGRRNKSYRRS